MAQVSGETLREEVERMLDEGLRNWDGGNAGVPKATEHSCFLVRSPPTEMTQIVEDVANGSSEIFKRSRMETAGTGEMIPVRPYRDTCKWFTGVPAARTLPLHLQHGTPLGQGWGSKRPREINVPIEVVSHQASDGGGVAGEGVAGGCVAGAGAAGGGVAGAGAASGAAAGAGAAGGGVAGAGAASGAAAGAGAAGGGVAGAGAASGGAADGRFDYTFNFRHDHNGDWSCHWTEDLMRVLKDRKFVVKSIRRSEPEVYLSWNAISDGA